MFRTTLALLLTALHALNELQRFIFYNQPSSKDGITIHHRISQTLSMHKTALTFGFIHSLFECGGRSVATEEIPCPDKPMDSAPLDLLIKTT